MLSLRGIRHLPGTWSDPECPGVNMEHASPQAMVPTKPYLSDLVCKPRNWTEVYQGESLWLVSGRSLLLVGASGERKSYKANCLETPPQMEVIQELGESW